MPSRDRGDRLEAVIRHKQRITSNPSTEPALRASTSTRSSASAGSPKASTGPKPTIAWALEKLNITDSQGFTQYGHRITDESLLDLAGAIRMLEGYECMCGAGWVNLVQATQKLVEYGPKHLRSPLFALVCLHVLSKIPAEDRMTFVTDSSDLLQQLAITDMPVAIKTFHEHVAPDEMKKFATDVMMFAFGPRFSSMPDRPIKSFADLLVQATEVELSDTAVNNLAIIRNFASLTAEQRLCALDVGMVLLPPCGTPKLPPELALALRRTEHRAGRWGDLAAQVRQAHATAPIYGFALKRDKGATIATMFHWFAVKEESSEPLPTYQEATRPAAATQPSPAEPRPNSPPPKYCHE